MIRALRVLKLTFAAALAMTAVTAPTAQANLFEAETYGPIFTFEHTTAHQLTVAGIPITCEHITFNNAGLSKAQTAFTVNGSYKKCKAKFGLAEKDITVTGLGDNSEKDWCVFELDAHGTLDLTCTGKAEVIFHSEICTVHIPPQKDIESLTYKNEGFGNTSDVKVTFNLTKIKYVLTKSPNALACEVATEGPYGVQREDFSYSGVSTMSGEVVTFPYKPIGIWVNFTE